MNIAYGNGTEAGNSQAARADVFTLKQHKEDRDARLARVFRHVYGLAGGVKTKG